MSQFQIKILYFAQLREQRGENSETISVESATTAEQVYHRLKEQYRFALDTESLRVAINEEFCGFDRTLKPGDHIAFIPPVSGG